jgi:hypothetical protein
VHEEGATFIVNATNRFKNGEFKFISRKTGSQIIEQMQLMDDLKQLS